MAMKQNKWVVASGLLPAKIDQAIEQPRVRDQVMALGLEPVKLQVEYELVCLAELMSVGGNLNNAQVKFIADQFIEMFPTESIADFKICFQRGAIGRYGQIQRMDGITLKGWMDQYLDEKYQVVEDLLMKEKDNLYKPLTDAERQHLQTVDVDKMLDEYKESIKHFDSRAILPMSDDDIKKYGKEEPHREVYKYDESEAGLKLKEVHESVFNAQEKIVRDRHPEWTEEQIQQRCEELRNELITQETKPKWSTDIGKIWEKKKKRKQ